MNRITVLITCCNERQHIAACIAAARRVADEILVADSGSTDGTLELIRAQRDCRLIEREYVTPSDFKNWALQHASHDWVLVVDADERVTPALAREIRERLASDSETVAFRIGHENWFLGYPIRYCGWSRKEGPVRLFRRSVCRYLNKRVHESLSVAGQNVENLTAKFLHFTAEELNEFVQKQARYSQLAALDDWEAGRRITSWGVLWRAPWRFLFLYLFRQGVRDGVPGLLVCATMAYYAFLKAAHLWRLQNAPAEVETGLEPAKAKVERGRWGWPSIGRQGTPRLTRPAVAPLAYEPSTVK